MIAHIKKDGTRQPVSDHNTATAELAEKRGAKIGLKNVSLLEGLLHDLGKGTAAFLDYIEKAHNDPKSVKRGSINHSSAGAKYVYETFVDRADENRLLNQLTVELISIAIASHHGLIDCLSVSGEDGFKRRINPQDEIYYDEAIAYSEKYFLYKYNLEDIYQKSKIEINDILNKIGQIVPQMSGNQDDRGVFINYMLGCLQRLVLSILIDGDHTDTAQFMLGVEYPSIVDEKNKNAFWKLMQARLEDRMSTFEMDSKISKIRSDVSKECFEFGRMAPGVYCLFLPTGSGKTLAAFRYAIQHCIEHEEKQKIIYTAPFLSILEQTCEEISNTLSPTEEEKAVAKQGEILFEDPDEFILEHHSNIVVPENLEVHGEERGEESEYIEGLRRYLTESYDAPFIFTTMVRLLNIMFSDGKQDIRRFHQLSNSVIIIDEIQSLPVKCVHMFNNMINFLSGVCNATVILCSATQPLLGRTDVPILYSEPRNMNKDCTELFRELKRVEIKWDKAKDKMYQEELGNFAAEIIEKIDDLLIILNTKPAVRELAQLMKSKFNEDEVEIINLTTLECAQHRSDIIKRMKENYLVSDQDTPPKKKLICISTQLIEAGVDISFQCVIRSLAGLDSIIQAAGRCNRHGEMSELGVVYVVDYAGENIQRSPDIEEGQSAVRKTLGELEQYPDRLDFDMTSEKAMNAYYEYYFFSRSKDMDYKEKHFTLYDLLSANRIGEQAYREMNSAKSKLILKQAFKTAGDIFQVIDDEAVTVLVPYGKGKQLISELEEIREPYEIKRKLKQMQRFTVSIRPRSGEWKELIRLSAVRPVLENSVYVLADNYYNDEYGISFEMENLII